MARSSNKGGRRRTLEQMDKDARALALYCQGMNYTEIAREIGWKTRAVALQAVRRAIADRQKDAFGQADEFTAAVTRIQAGIRRCQEIIDTPHFLATPGGKIATVWDVELEQDVPVLDDGPKQRAITEMRHLNDQLITLMDLKPASKQRVEVVTQDVVNDEIARLAKEVGELANARETAGSGIPREP